PSRFNKEYFRNGVTKPILITEIRGLVMKSSSSDTADLANIVANTPSKMGCEIPRHFPEAKLELARICKTQRMSPRMTWTVDNSAHTVLEVLTAHDRPQANVTQWAKQQACWERVKRAPVDFDDGFQEVLVEREVASSRRTDSKKLQAMDNEFADIVRVMSVRADVWDAALTRGVSENLLTSAQVGIIGKLRQGGLVPSGRQSKAAL